MSFETVETGVAGVAGVAGGGVVVGAGGDDADEKKNLVFVDGG